MVNIYADTWIHKTVAYADTLSTSHFIKIKAYTRVRVIVDYADTLSA